MKKNYEIWIDKNNESARVFNVQLGQWIGGFYSSKCKQEAIERVVKVGGRGNWTFKYEGED